MTDADKAMLTAVLPIAHEHGVPADAMNKFVGKFMELQQGTQQQVVAQIEEFGRQAETSLKREWGADFEPNLNIANRTAERIGTDFKAFLNVTPLATGGMLGDHPVLIKALANLGRGLGEGDLMLGATREEQASIQEQIEVLNKSVPVGSTNYTAPGHQQKLQGLYEKLHGRTGIVGSGQRAA
jgi:hypothetical protein